MFLLIISDLDRKCNILVKIDLSYLFCRAFSAKNKAEPITAIQIGNFGKGRPLKKRAGVA